MHDNVVLVGVDGSRSSAIALEWAYAQAVARKAKLKLVCAYTLPSYAAHATTSLGTGITDGKLLYEAALSMVKEMAISVIDRDVEVSWELVEGDPSEVLVELSKRVALLVVGGKTAKQGRIADVILRTVSTAVPAHAHCPTVVVSPADVVHLPVKKVVVGLDDSEYSELALQRAVWEAHRWNTKLEIVSSVNVDAVSWVPQFTLSEEFFAEVRNGIVRQLEGLADRREVEVDITVTQGNPTTILADMSQNADLLVLGTRGRGGFAGLFLGSTAQTILEHASCPTMVVPRRLSEYEELAEIEN